MDSGKYIEFAVTFTIVMRQKNPSKFLRSDPRTKYGNVEYGKYYG